jgi:hypothetical protein
MQTKQSRIKGNQKAEEQKKNALEYMCPYQGSLFSWFSLIVTYIEFSVYILVPLLEILIFFIRSSRHLFLDWAYL